MNAPNVADLITIEPGHRGGQPCIRGLRITVRDVLEHLAGGMTVPKLLEDFPDLTTGDISACFAFAADLLSQYDPSNGPPVPLEVRTEQPAPPASVETAFEIPPGVDLGWLGDVIGSMKGEPALLEAAELGRAYRMADRPDEEST